MIKTQLEALASNNIIFVPCVDDPGISGYYYKATLDENDNTSHYILLYNVGVNLYKEPKTRWIMLDITEHHSSEDRGDSETVMNAVETYDSLHSILTYVGDVYNTGTRFYDEPRTGKYIP